MKLARGVGFWGPTLDLNKNFEEESFFFLHLRMEVLLDVPGSLMVKAQS